MRTATFKLPRKRHCRGFSLVELLVGVIVGLLVIAGTISLIVNTAKSSTDTLKSSRLSQDLGAVMHIMVTDLRRAGYWSGSSPYDSAGPSVAFGSETAVGSGLYNCILYSYDLSGNGAQESNEYFGYRLNGSGVDMRISGDSYTDCADGDNSWQGVLDTNVTTITALTFKDNSICVSPSTGSTVACGSAVAGDVKLRQVEITLSGRLTGDAGVTKILQELVRLRNDEVL